jgi:hypothetical protein
LHPLWITQTTHDKNALQVRFSMPIHHRVRAEFGIRRAEEPPRLPMEVQQRYEPEMVETHAEQGTYRMPLAAFSHHPLAPPLPHLPTFKAAGKFQQLRLCPTAPDFHTPPPIHHRHIHGGVLRVHDRGISHPDLAPCQPHMPNPTVPSIHHSSRCFNDL